MAVENDPAIEKDREKAIRTTDKRLETQLLLDFQLLSAKLVSDCKDAVTGRFET
jgi:hypothetical protein